MKREIKFRGKRLDNEEWIYSDESFVHTEAGVFIGPYNDEKQVDPETVGQYTGLKDRNGKEIFEGDILACMEYHNNAIGLFDYYEISELDITDVKGELEREAIGYINTEYASMYFEETDESRIDISVFGEGKFSNPIYECDVVGNIHDNPEWLKGGER